MATGLGGLYLSGLDHAIVVSMVRVRLILKQAKRVLITLSAQESVAEHLSD